MLSLGSAFLTRSHSRERFDPEGHFIRRYVPELAELPTKYIHFPAAMPPLQLQGFGVRLGQDYPRPVVNHTAARERTLMRFHFLSAKEA